MLLQLFDQVLTKESNSRDYDLTAVIAYYGKHYSTFCYHGKHQEWVYLDDANVRKVGFIYVTQNSSNLMPQLIVTVLCHVIPGGQEMG